MADECWISATTVDASEAGSYVLKVDGYSRAKKLFKNCEYLTSAPFSFADHSWVMRYYPNGYDDPEYISVELALDSTDASDVKVEFEFTLLDQDGVQVPSYKYNFDNYSSKVSDTYFDFIKKADLEGSVYFGGDSFSIRCDMTMTKDIHKAKQFVVVPPSNLHRHLGDLLDSMDGADVIFHVGGERLSVHRSVLAARSSVFKAQLCGAMKENFGDPIEIKDMESDIFKSLLHFIYTDSLPAMTREGTDEGAAREDIVTVSHLLRAADKYNIERLKLICEEKLCNHIDSGMLATSLSLAEQHSFSSRMAERCRISATTVAASETRSYVLEVDGYSRAKKQLGICEFVTSEPFSFGGHSWVMFFYPNGYDDPEYISFELALDFTDANGVKVRHKKEDGVKAKFELSLLDQDGVKVKSYGFISSVRIYLSKGPGCVVDFMRKRVLEKSDYLAGDSFSMRCDITIMKEDIHKGKQFVVVPPSNLHRHLDDLLKSMDGADVIFHVGGERLSAHRSVLAARSSVFKAQLFGTMKENFGSPIEVVDMESDIFKSLLHFIYTDSLPGTTHERTDEAAARGNIVTASHLLVAADKYNIERLKLICEEKLCNHIDSDMVATSLALAEQHTCHGLKKACFEFLALNSNLEAMMASDGYEHLKISCPTVLKELVAGFLPAELKAARDIIMSS